MNIRTREPHPSHREPHQLDHRLYDRLLWAGGVRGLRRQVHTSVHDPVVDYSFLYSSISRHCGLSFALNRLITLRHPFFASQTVGAAGGMALAVVGTAGATVECLMKRRATAGLFQRQGRCYEDRGVRYHNMNRQEKGLCIHESIQGGDSMCVCVPVCCFRSVNEY